MKISKKLLNYFDETGVQKNWFARKIGMDPKLFYQILSGHRAVAQQFWKPMIQWTGGKISLKDLIENCLPEVEGLYIEGIEGKLTCEISLKELNTEANIAI